MTNTLGDFVYFTIPQITTKITNKGEEKKELIGMPKEWTKNITKENYKNYIKQHHKAFCLPAGEINNITIIDFDDKSSYEYVLKKHPELKNYKTIQTRRGFHVYCKYNSKLHTQTNCLKSISGVDIANDKHMVFAPPTSYYTLDGTLNKYVDIGGEILDIPAFIIEDYKYSSDKPKKQNIKKQEETTDEESEITMENNQSMSDIEYLLMECIQNNICDTESQPKWSNVGQAIKNELKDEGVLLFVDWTKKYGTENRKSEAFTHYTKHLKYTSLKDKNRLSIASLHFWAKKYNEDSYYLRFKKQSIIVNEDIEIVLISQTEYAIATYFNKLYGHNYKCVDLKQRIFYKFNEKNLWVEDHAGSTIRNLLSNDFKNKFEDYKNTIIDYINKSDNQEFIESLKKKIKIITEVIYKLEKTNDKNNIVREIMDIIIDTEFANDMNKEKYVLPIKNNKMLNLKTLETYERTINNKFNYECNADYIELSEEQENEINQYFLDLFCGKQDMVDCVIDIFKSIFTGETLRYIYFFTGAGCNGKSLLFKILHFIFKKSMDRIDSSVIIDKKMNNQISTQFEKLDKCRLGYITELKESDKLHESNIKMISGGDPIDLRALFKTNQTIIPTLNMCVLTNQLPQFEKEKAIVDRIVVVPFLNTFQVDLSFETTMMNKADLIFSYIMKRGVIRDKFNLSEDMIASKQNYLDANEKDDYLKDFIDEKFDIVTFVKNEKILNNEFGEMYSNWLFKNGYTDNKKGVKLISKRIKSYGINVKESNGTTTYRGLKIKEFVEEEE